MLLRRLAIIASLFAASAAVGARPLGCDDDKLPPDQRWNGATSFETPELGRFYDLADQMSAAYKSAAPHSAARIGREYLAAAERFPCNWNYGNAVHNANSILGLLALEKGDRASSVQYLRAAGASPGSPQLDTFGPSLLLARELALAGEFVAVEAYLASIRKFWKPTDMSPIGLLLPRLANPDPMATWTSDLKQKRVPNFGPFNVRSP